MISLTCCVPGLKIHLDSLGWILWWPYFEVSAFPMTDLFQGPWNVTQLNGGLCYPFAPQEDLYHEHTHLEKENDPDKVEK